MATNDEITPLMVDDKSSRATDDEQQNDADVPPPEDSATAKKPVLESLTSGDFRLAESVQDDLSQQFFLKVNGEGQTALHLACLEGQTHTIRAISERLDEATFEQLVLMQDKYEQTALHGACLMGETDVVRFLSVLLSDAVYQRLVLMTDNYSRTALYLACMMGKTEAFQVVADKLPQDVFESVAMVTDTDNQTILHCACSRDLVDVANYIADHLSKEKFVEIVMMQDRINRTALHLTCQYGPTDVVQVITDKLKDKRGVLKRLVLVTDDDNQTALHLACTVGLTNAAKLLLERLPMTTTRELLTIKDKSNKTALELASDYMQYETLSAILYSKHCASGKLVMLVPKNLIVQACERGAQKTVLSILRAADMSDREGGILRDFLQTEDDDKKTVLQIASYRGERELVRGIIKIIQKLHKVWVSSFICHADAMGRTALHESCHQGDNQIVKMLLDEARRVQCVPSMLCAQDTRKLTALYIAFESGIYINVTSIVDQAATEEKGFVEELLSLTNIEEQTLFHRACQGQYHNMRCVEAVLNVAQKEGVLIELLHKKDSSGKTFLAYIPEAKSTVMQLFIKAITDSEIEALENPKSQQADQVHFFLTDTDKTGTNVMSHAQQAQRSKALKLFLTPFMDVQGEIPKRPEDFHLLHKVSVMADYDKNHSNNLLTHMGSSGCLDLINHEYTQTYIRLCWTTFGRYFFHASLVLYAIVLISLTVFIMSHEPNLVNVLSATANSSETELTFSVLQCSTVFQVFLIIFSVLTLVSEFLQMLAKGKHYWKGADNYADLGVCFGSLIVSIAPLCSVYSAWHHQLGTVTMCVAWINAAWLMTKISFGRFQSTSLQFIMLFRVIKAVCVFLPVFAIFIVTFALAFNSLFRGQESFNNFGYTIMKIMVMTTGELEFASIISPDDDIGSSPFYPLGCILFLVFIGVMTISAMNLLVGVAVGDINELRSQSEVLAFKSQVELILESQAMVALFKKCHATVDRPI